MARAWAARSRSPGVGCPAGSGVPHSPIELSSSAIVPVVREVWLSAAAVRRQEGLAALPACHGFPTSGEKAACARAVGATASTSSPDVEYAETYLEQGEIATAPERGGAPTRHGPSWRSPTPMLLARSEHDGEKRTGLTSGSEARQLRVNRDVARSQAGLWISTASDPTLAVSSAARCPVPARSRWLPVAAIGSARSRWQRHVVRGGQGATRSRSRTAARPAQAYLSHGLYLRGNPAGPAGRPSPTWKETAAAPSTAAANPAITRAAWIWSSAGSPHHHPS